MMLVDGKSNSGCSSAHIGVAHLMFVMVRVGDTVSNQAWSKAIYKLTGKRNWPYSAEEIRD